MNRNIAGNEKIIQDLTFAEKGITYHGLEQNEEKKKKKHKNLFIVQTCKLYRI
jgi:hypothetical protein